MSTRKSLFFSFVDRYASLAIAVGSSMVIARLLTPTEIGVFSVTMGFLMLLAAVRDMGAGQYLVQEKNLTHDRIRAVWAVQLGLGLGLALVIFALSMPVAAFYGETRIRDIMLVIAVNYAINPFGSLTYAWLMREMRFESVAMMRFASSVAGAVISIYLAWKNFGAISLAYGSLAATVVNALLAVYFRPKVFPWFPGLKEIRRVLNFGSQVTASTILTVAAGSSPELLLGKLQDLASAGYFSRANGLVQMFYRLFVDAVGAVCLPWFAKQSRDNGGLVDPFVKATSYVTVFGWAFCFAVICLAHPIVRILYGNQWDHAVDLTRLLALGTALSVPAALCQTVLLSSGGAKIVMQRTLIGVTQYIALAAIGAYLGLMALGVAMIVANANSATLWVVALQRHIKMPMVDYFIALRKSLYVALLSAIGPAFALWQFGAYPAAAVPPLLVGGLAGLVGFVAGVVWLNHPVLQEFEALTAKFVRRRK